MGDGDKKDVGEALRQYIDKQMDVWNILKEIEKEPHLKDYLIQEIILPEFRTALSDYLDSQTEKTLEQSSVAEIFLKIISKDPILKDRLIDELFTDDVVNDIAEKVYEKIADSF